MALFLVLVLPACWYGALSRAWIERSQGPSSANSNEEREEHQERDEHRVVGLGTPPPPRPRPRPRSSVRLASVSRAAPAIVASVAPRLHPSVFSVRRLI